MAVRERVDGRITCVGALNQTMRIRTHTNVLQYTPSALRSDARDNLLRLVERADHGNQLLPAGDD
jgi:hypothetical protein